MNFYLFKAIFGTGPVPDKMISASLSEDDLGVLLRVHLISEHFLQAFISAAINKGNLYYGETEDKEKSKRGFFSKLETARGLGLPEPTFSALKVINLARNESVHQIENDSIKSDLIEAIEAFSNQLTEHTDIDLNKHVMQTFDEHGQPLAIYEYNNPATPMRVKLLISYSCLIRRTLETLGLNPRHASSSVAAGTFVQDSPAVNNFSAKLMNSD